ncbi:hypothetical protein CPAST_c22090 [Clostridium pasteurianum DSM 525 = ATCC 6013]|uniref:Uncharacterized protein n=1 Tax=Clostridium pasteurianum DSM 525 = ATCC 6013 TaxID=1262449 RepID=A0A0H3J475_CLOPA|nr:hypothetical protein [Clostridium pasteurianum]AJA48279.1 hypothetical protein CPAST_c22090 [Clostridium pasteurianum DSM 525 = ATCC 6013]AJA52267.1 hypothetical protein CLPA_c22090 [Clostridium pasteurianum DSM 525 = ATCC 6013]AOZ75532.1 hypothetical protein AQ983_10725 [Clostridium pasteurianum DSM 525 = ATCC 6013]AOZ79327.1 hypothetical protein AQ984_10715 [Clostridium pasteurianum]ELP60571.1 hypothetical protein F502_03762 [Clostridium pasteurianum DSM 525 = ATCC 6013]
MKNDKELNNLIKRIEFTEKAMEETLIVLQTLNKIFIDKGIYDIEKFHDLMEKVSNDDTTNFTYRDTINKLKENSEE